ncbi:hypothetical protein [Rothia nasisuis]|uniref:hypothetical protein n=1 Tax=Rothia nasisuis TaxID=2109647 RepID=UPI001F474AB1|nr:hypothetical protein [Rothia nasisuis]
MKKRIGREKFEEDLASVNHDPEYFLSSLMLDGVPRTWSENLLDFTKWRHLVAKSIEVNPLCVLVVGSARLGYSLNPDKNFKIFDKESDIDIAIISSEYFERCWKEIRNLIKNEDIPKHEIGNIRRLLVNECIPLDLILPSLSFGQKWKSHEDKIIMDLGENFYGNEIKYRIYRNHDALLDYQRLSIKNSMLLIESEK